MARFTLIVTLCINLTGFGGYNSKALGKPSPTTGVHAIGDGNICVYGQGSNIIQLFGAPYSTPSILRLTLSGTDSTRSERVSGTAIWNHQIIRGGSVISTETDFISSLTGSFIRKISTTAEVTYNLEVNPDSGYKNYSSQISVNPEEESSANHAHQSYLVEVQKGVPLMFSYLPPRGRYYRLVLSGNATLVPVDSTNKKLRLKLLPGNSKLVVIAGESVAELDKRTNIINLISADSLFSLTRRYWKEFSAAHQRVTEKMNVPSLKNAIDDISVLIKSQQGADGGVVAGHAYHMGYVRDQYGVSRGLLAMENNEEAKKILEFYFQNWQEAGYIKNAQAIGFPHIFHRHENDEVEITGYLVLQSMDYFAKTNDYPFIHKILPMLEWAIEAQKKNLADGMLPFNGDETYIAGGILPRKVMYNGSAEATLLFIEGTTRLLNYLNTNKLWNPEKIADLKKTVQDCADRYRKNFFQKGILVTNNPEREVNIRYPASRYGVCLHPQHGGYASEVFHFKGSLYFCKDCMKKDNSMILVPEPEVFSIVSVSLFPFYINSTLFTTKEKKQLVERVIKYYQKTGNVSEKNVILGSDYGFFLDGLVAVNNALKDKIFLKMMNLRDDSGSWVEYYNSGMAMGCKCRPWESGVNIEAAIRYWEKK